MQGPNTDTQTHDLVVIGLYHLEALEFFEETAPLADGFSEINDQLHSTHQALTKAERSHAPRQAMLPLIDVELDALVMAFAEYLTGEDGGKPGALHEKFFPEGVERVVDPVGVQEAEAVRRMVATLREDAAVASLKVPWEEALAKSLKRYDEAIAAHDTAATALHEARDTANAARKAWFDAVAKHCEEIEIHFPDTPVTQHLFFYDSAWE